MIRIEIRSPEKLTPEQLKQHGHDQGLLELERRHGFGEIPWYDVAVHYYFFQPQPFFDIERIARLEPVIDGLKTAGVLAEGVVRTTGDIREWKHTSTMVVLLIGKAGHYD